MTPELHLQSTDLYRQSAVGTARWLCHQRIKVFPLTYASKGDETVKWKDVATNDFNTFVSRIPRQARFNLAMVFGPDSGVMDIEPDSPEASVIIEDLMRQNGVVTIAYASRRGVHRLFRWEPRFSHWNNANPKAGKLDIRYGTESKSVYSVCPPSIHPDTGLPYVWLPGCAPWEVGLANCPENVVQYCLTNVGQNVGGKTGQVIEVDQYDDGFMPSEGNRHAYLLGFSKLMHNDLLIPLEHAKELTRYMSHAIGSYDEIGRGEVEIDNCFKKLRRPVDHIKEMSTSISMASVREAVIDTVEVSKYAAPKEEGVLAEIPAHIFHPKIQEASLHAKAAQYPRNMWLMTTLTATAAALGSSALVKSHVDSDPMGTQIFAFGVGGSGSGKSRTLKALLAPFSDSDALITDATPEALTTHLVKHPRGVLLELSEGKEFAKMLNRYNGQGGGLGSDNALFHKAWSGERIRVQRQQRSYCIEFPHLVVAAGIQRLNLNMIPQNDLVDGLSQRMILYPLGDIPKELDLASLRKHAEFIREWYDIVGRLRTVKAVLGTNAQSVVEGGGVHIKPMISILDGEAQKVFADYALFKKSDKVISQWPNSEHPFRSDLVRHAEYALRIAKMLFVQDLSCDRDTWYAWDVANWDYGWIPASIMRRAIDLMEFLWMHKQIYLDALVEQAFAAASGLPGLAKSESLGTKLEGMAADRKRRIERMVGEEWTIRDYYTIFKLKKMEAQHELDIFLREQKVTLHELKEGQKALRYSFRDLD